MGKRASNWVQQIGAMALGGVCFLLSSCADERPLRPVIGDPYRLAKKDLDGEFLFLKSVAEVVHAGTGPGELHTGKYLESDRIVRFQIREKSIDVVSQEPIIETSGLQRSPLLARFAAQPVDVLRKETNEGQPTNEEEVTQTRRPADQRTYVVLDTASDRIGRLGADTTSAIPIDLSWDPAAGALNFLVEHTLEDETTVRIRYSFLRYEKSATYVPRPYSEEEQKRFGFFKSSHFYRDASGRYSRSARRDFLNRWDTSRPTVFHLAPGSPASLADLVQKIFDNYNEAFIKAIGRPQVVLDRSPSPYPIGDLRANLLVYDETPDDRGKMLGYGPCTVDPRTGEIKQALIVVDAGSLRRARFSGRALENAFSKAREVPGTASLIDKTLGLFFGAPSTFEDPFLFARSNPPPDDKWLIDAKARSTYESAIARLRDRQNFAQVQRTTFVDENILLGLASNREAPSFSDAKLEQSLFVPLVLHELGHTVGLRHNFMASADHQEHGKPSSVMDYLFLPSEEPEALGPYDVDAIRFAYSDANGGNNRPEASYLYCTDEQLFDSKQALCQQNDSGSTLTSLIKSQVERYKASYFINNYRNDNEFFELEEKDYETKVYSLLVPIRHAFDNAHGIILASQIPNRQESKTALWRLLGKRIEADSKSEKRELLELSSSVPKDRIWPLNAFESPVRRWIDPKKLENATNDAYDARAAAFSALQEILLENKRTEEPKPHLLFDGVEVRGVLLDKVIALKLLTAATPNPSIPGTLIKMYDAPEVAAKLRDLFVALISNTLPLKDSKDRVFYKSPRFNPALRHLALDTLTKELAPEEIGKPNTAAGARKLLTIEKLDHLPLSRQSPDAAEFHEIAENILGLSIWEKQFAPLKSLMPVISATYPGPKLISSFWRCSSSEDCPLSAIEVRGVEAMLERARATRDESEDAALREYAPLQAIAWRRKQIRAVYKAHFKDLLQNVTDEQHVEALISNLHAAESHRNKINEAYATIDRQTLLRAPIFLRTQGFQTASGRLIRDNINRAEDNLLALNELIMEMLEPIKAKKADLQAPVDWSKLRAAMKLEELRQQLEASIDEEKLFLKLIYREHEGLWRR